MTTLKERIDQAATILSPYDLPEDFLTTTLAKLGIDDSDIGLQVLEAETTIFEDFESALLGILEAKTIPVPRLKLIWSILKNQGEEKKKESTWNLEQQGNSIIASLRPIGQWADLELIEQYGRDCQVIVEDELKVRSKGNYIIIFDDAGNVDAENTLYMLRLARRQTTPATYKIRGEIKKVYRVGEFPMDVFYECPIHSHVLLVDGYCDECGLNWKTEDTDRNAFIRLIVQTEHISDMRPYRSQEFDKLKEIFPKVWIKFIGLKETDDLPKLRRKVSQTREGDPFRVVGSHTQF